MEIVGDGVFGPYRVGFVPGGVLQLHEFAFDEVGNHRGHEFGDFGVAEAGEGDGGAAEEEIAGQDGHFVAKGDVGGGGGAAGVGAVDDVVVEEGGRVD